MLFLVSAAISGQLKVALTSANVFHGLGGTARKAMGPDATLENLLMPREGLRRRFNVFCSHREKSRFIMILRNTITAIDGFTEVVSFRAGGIIKWAGLQ